MPPRPTQTIDAQERVRGYTSPRGTLRQRIRLIPVLGLCIALAACTSTPESRPRGIQAHVGPTTQTRMAIIRAAAARLGAPYKPGAGGPEAFDDNGLVRYAYARAGITLPRAPHALLGAGPPITLARAEPADLVFYQTHVAGGADSLRVGLYLNDHEILYASARRGRVVIQRVDASWWRGRLLGVVSVLPRPQAR